MGQDDKENYKETNSFHRFCMAVAAAVEAPVTWVRETIVTPNRSDHVWHHRQFRRVPTIDQCYTDDVVCIYEANEQYKRDKSVDDEILSILRKRQEDCYMQEGPDRQSKCAKLVEDYEVAAADWFAKHGDMGAYKDVIDVYMKQKHRMVWERRHGPVGSGMKQPESA